MKEEELAGHWDPRKPFLMHAASRQSASLQDLVQLRLSTSYEQNCLVSLQCFDSWIANSSMVRDAFAYSKCGWSSPLSTALTASRKTGQSGPDIGFACRCP